MKKILIVTILALLSNLSFALQPDNTYILTPDSLGLKYDSQIIKTEDNASLNVWTLKASDSNNNETTIILNYGDAGNMSYWLYQAGILNQIGYTVVLFDYRGFGYSSDFVINQDQLYYDEFATDLKTVIKWVKQNQKFDKLGILSFSMGTIMSTIALQSEKVDFFVGEGFVRSPEEIKNKIYELKQKQITLPENSNTYENLISKISIPMLLFSGTLDNITTVEDSKSIVAQRSNRKLIEFNGNHLEGFHILSGKYYGEEYLNGIYEFIKNIP